MASLTAPPRAIAPLCAAPVTLRIEPPHLESISDILGHRSSSSTSVYVRVALERLRAVALPVPR